MIITLDEAKEHLRVDFNEDDNYIQVLIDAAGEFIKNATGNEFDSSNPLAKTACMFIVGDLYDNRNATTDKLDEKIRNIVNMILIQLSFSYGGDT